MGNNGDDKPEHRCDMPWYQTRPTRLQAIQWTGDNLAEVQKYRHIFPTVEHDGELWFAPLEANKMISKGFYVVYDGMRLMCIPPGVFIEQYMPLQAPGIKLVPDKNDG